MSSDFQNSYDDSSADSIGSSQNDVSNASASEDHGSTGSIPRSGLETPMALARLSGSNSRLPNFQPHQQAVLFHLSLIEGRCRTQAAISLNAGRRLEDHLPENHPEVHSLTQHLFGEMTKELHKAGILPDEFAGQELSELRRNYLSSFDTILRNIASQRKYQFQDNTYSSLFDRSNAYQIGGELSSTSLTNARSLALQQYTMAAGQNPIPDLLALLKGNVYKNTYKEICLLGKGGFGEVYKAHHFLTGIDYAVKKVFLRPDMIGDGNPQSKVEEFAAELRTLARLNHRNIVRYHTSWAETREMANVKDRQNIQAGGRRIEEAPFKLEKHLDESQDGIVFGYSASSAKGQKEPRKGNNALVKAKKSVFFHNPDSSSDTDSDDSDEDVDGEASANSVVGGEGTEDISRAGGKGAFQSSAIGFNLSDIVFFIQMSLHPMSLEDYLWPEQQKSGQPPAIEHCYHSLPTARILLAILDGVEYIHRNKIVHRDLKPANIMLSVSEDPASMLNGSIRINDCPDCQDHRFKELYITPHICDFGLVADIKDPESNNLFAQPTTTTSDTNDKSIQAPALSGLSSMQPGTRFYCAPKARNGKTLICPKVDVYSLGVIALEMICKFGTRSERNVELNGLKDRIFPSGFEHHEMSYGIKQMLCCEREQRWGCEQVRNWLEKLIKKLEKPGKEIAEMEETDPRRRRRRMST